ncbi:MAG TPA: hypothetical protein VJC39_05380 [Candidatus Nanoarchaeia archaeon]|nr:hypothetical protein [Candidatus Nanoarchaeia archaeon]
MHPFWKQVEENNSKLIGPALLILLVVIIVEIFVHTENETIKTIIHFLDYAVITIFTIDLIFLAIHSKNARFFFQRYWLDILAIFPFALVFNVVNQLYRVIVATERIAVTQAIVHETVEIGKEVSLAAREGSKAPKIIRLLARGMRLITKSHLFEKFQTNLNKQRSKKTKPKKK